ncbi:MAG: histone deacetylase [Thermoplasmata archaeon HGW-Thermoplasmata-1]|nr:MAG: histone deacetylase [Thermoplasmata archaeon HGW-Thermoplasmata-1]
MKALRAAPFSQKLSFMQPEREADETMLRGVHSEYMINEVRRISDAGGGWIDIDTYVSRGSYDIARLAAGTALQASRMVIDGKLESAFCAVRPPGHHATKHLSMGFCLFNNVAVAANELAKLGLKVLIYDHDVHHGNGTQEIFYDRNDVLYMSTHAWPYYPGTGQIKQIGEGNGEGFNVNAPMPRGTDNEMVRMVHDEVMLPIARQFGPDIILFSAGFDSHYSDPLGVFKFTTGFFHEFTRKFMEVQPRFASVLEGGYDMESLPQGVMSQVSAMCGEGAVLEEPQHPSYALAEGKRIVRELKRTFEGYWSM